MANPHANLGAFASLPPLGGELAEQATTVLIKTEYLEVIRIVLLCGRRSRIPEVSGEIALMCLDGKVSVDLGDREIELTAGDLTYHGGHDVHGLRAVRDSIVFITILAWQRKGQPRPCPSNPAAELNGRVSMAS